MIRFLIAITAVLCVMSSAEARHHRYYRVAAHKHAHHAQHAYRRHYGVPYTAPHFTPGPETGLTTVKTAAGINITVASTHADKFVSFIADIVAAGYTPRDIGCYAQRSAGGAHPLGAACDFDQSGRNLTAAFMYRLGELASKHGLRDGCSFGDCGHIEDGSRVYVLNGGYRRYAGHTRHYAGRHPRIRYAQAMFAGWFAWAPQPRRYRVRRWS